MSNSTTKNKKGFNYGFILGIVISIFAQIITFCDVYAYVGNPSPEIVSHRAWDIGFPFSMYSGWYALLSNGKPDFDGFLLNLIFAAFFSVVIGLIFKFKNEVKNSINSFTFVIGFIIGTLCFLFLNYFTHIVINTDSYHFRIFGFPFRFIQVSDINSLIIWRVLIANILVAVISSFVFGLIFNFVWSKVAARKLK